ncbi:hypothetical protein PG990_008725 [Apiospora arundinis]
MSERHAESDERIKSEVKPDDALEGSGETKLPVNSHGATAKLTGFRPDEFLPEDLPVVDPKYLDPNLVSATNLPQSRTGIPPAQWVPAEIYREHSNSSIYEPHSVVGESGRMYHGYKEGKYLLPNDAAEQERLDLQHKAFTILLGDKLHLAPIGEPRHVLDIGTGTGIWALEFAREYPQAHVIGADLSKIQPEDALANVEFIRDDVEDEWVFSHKFDYIHSRMNFSCFDNPKGVMEQAFQFLNPGGWIEYLDAESQVVSMDGTAEGKLLYSNPDIVHCTRPNKYIGTTIQKWGQLIAQGLASRGRDPHVAKQYKGWLRDIGFVDIIERKMPSTQGGWAKNPRLKLSGRYFERDVYDGVKGISFRILRAAGIPAEEIESIADQVRIDLLNPHIHTYWPVRCVYGRKPFEWETAGGSA